MLDLLVPLGSVVCALAIYLLVTRPALRRAKHRRTLTHIRQLERELGIEPLEPARPDPTMALLNSFSRMTTEVMRSPYSFSRGNGKPSRPLVEVNHGGLGVRLEDIPPGQLPPK